MSERRLNHRILITIDALENPEGATAETLPQFIHDVAAQTFHDDLVKAKLNPWTEGITVAFQELKRPKEEAYGRKVYAWAYSVPVPKSYLFGSIIEAMKENETS